MTEMLAIKDYTPNERLNARLIFKGLLNNSHLTEKHVIDACPVLQHSLYARVKLTTSDNVVAP